jgi:hypothetical protein
MQFERGIPPGTPNAPYRAARIKDERWRGGGGGWGPGFEPGRAGPRLSVTSSQDDLYEDVDHVNSCSVRWSMLPICIPQHAEPLLRAACVCSVEDSISGSFILSLCQCCPFLFEMSCLGEACSLSLSYATVSLQHYFCLFLFDTWCFPPEILASSLALLPTAAFMALSCAC